MNASSSLRPSKSPRLSPNLLAALNDLAAVEHLPVSTLVAVLLNEALDHRLHRRRRHA
jgi:hypothetical protein